MRATRFLLVLAAALGCRGEAPAGGGRDAPAQVGGAPSTVSSQPSPPARPGGDPAAGHALLARYTADLRALAASGDPTPLAAALDAREAEVRALADQAAVSAEVRDRALRLIQATRAVVAPDDDPARRAKQAELDAFVLAVRGGGGHPDPAGGLAAYGPILLEEVVSLHMLLDGSTDREHARARYLAEP